MNLTPLALDTYNSFFGERTQTANFLNTSATTKIEIAIGTAAMKTATTARSAGGMPCGAFNCNMGMATDVQEIVPTATIKTLDGPSIVSQASHFGQRNCLRLERGGRHWNNVGSIGELQFGHTLRTRKADII